MDNQAFEVRFTRGKFPSGGGYVGLRPGHRVDEALGMICEYDVPITMRDGVKIYVNIFRPKAEGKYPVVLAWAPYGKHEGAEDYYAALPGCGQSKALHSEYARFEGPDPAEWCRYGYIIVYVDPRGAWGSEGDLTFMSPQEALDGYDVVEWAGTQAWSNGMVGMNGVSYLGWSQWKIAAMNPPHLAAINPWEGVSDFYRELVYHGGIRSNFTAMFPGTMCRPTKRAEDLLAMAKEHPLFDDYWASKNADLAKITVPAFVVASWSDHGLHTRGTLEGFKKIASTEKWLRVHGRKKWVDYYAHADMQRQFFDRFLKGIDNEVKYWPKVNLEVRERSQVGNYRAENEWPLARTKYTKLFLGASKNELNASPLKELAQSRYAVDDLEDKSQNAFFEFAFKEKTELTGHSKLKIWVEAVGSDDMDLFVVIDKFDRTGDRVPFPSQSGYDHGPVAYGWLRASHRELDEERSTAHQPVLKHQKEIKLNAGEVVPVEIELWPASVLFEQGETLRVTVIGSDLHAQEAWKHDGVRSVNRGVHVIHTGGKYDSHLLVPIIPAV
jgi:predicted acyl esterase